MIAVDTQILVFATRRDSQWHDIARERVEELGRSPAAWAIPWPCVHEFVRIVTQPGIYNPPSPLAGAFESVKSWRASESLHFLSEGSEHLSLLVPMALRAKAIGGKIHDARIAAICLANGVSELWSADRDFSRFPDLKVVNPLVR